MIEKEKIKKMFESKLVKDEKILLFGEQIRPWRFISKFWAVLLFIIMIWLFVTFILPLPLIGIGFIEDDIIPFLILIILPEIILLIIFIKNRPLKNLKNKEQKWYYALTNYRIMYFRRKMLLGNSFYCYELDDIALSVSEIDILGYRYSIGFSHISNDNYECGTSSGYRIWVKSQEEVDNIKKIIEEHPNSDEKTKLRKNYYTNSQILKKVFINFIWLYCGCLLYLYIIKALTIKIALIAFLLWTIVQLLVYIPIIRLNIKDKKNRKD